MDGQSVLRLLKASRDPRAVDKRGFVTLKRPWRDTILFERGKLSEKILKQRMKTEAENIFGLNERKQPNMLMYLSDHKRRIYKECSKGDNQLPCKEGQKWFCIEENSRMRKYKCKNSNLSTSHHLRSGMQNDEAAAAAVVKQPCSCLKARMLRRMGRRGRRRHRRNLRYKTKREFMTRYARVRRSAPAQYVSSHNSQALGFPGFEAMFNRRCRILSNQSVQCDMDIYRKSSEWEMHK